AYTLGYALLGSLLLSLTLVPAMCKVLLNKHITVKNNPIVNFFRETIFKLFNIASKYRKVTFSTFIVIFAICIFKLMNYGTEFIPQLNE
ncbi:efflux RND transporter permease subunit, partial [Streptomyces scabiei]|uniref:efflux RND transporter permease subunit n=1 Tax=Streptomyces scabiei TaxID=1930 RepID=UPI0038F75621